MNSTMPLPSPDVIADYEKLGIVGILIFVLLIGLVLIGWAVRRFSSLAREAFAFVKEQTAALTSLKDAHAQQQENQTRLHERMDELMSCTRKECPVFEMRQKQQAKA